MNILREALVVVLPSNDEVSHWARKGLLGEVVTAKEYMAHSKAVYMGIAETPHECDIKECDECIKELDEMTHKLSDKIARYSMGVL